MIGMTGGSEGAWHGKKNYAALTKHLIAGGVSDAGGVNELDRDGRDTIARPDGARHAYSRF
jgi:hypothetical protein